MCGSVFAVFFSKYVRCKDWIGFVPFRIGEKGGPFFRDVRSKVRWELGSSPNCQKTFARWDSNMYVHLLSFLVFIPTNGFFRSSGHSWAAAAKPPEGRRFSTSTEVLKKALQLISQSGGELDVVCMLQPALPGCGRGAAAALHPRRGLSPALVFAAPTCAPAENESQTGERQRGHSSRPGSARRTLPWLSLLRVQLRRWRRGPFLRVRLRRRRRCPSPRVQLRRRLRGP